MGGAGSLIQVYKAGEMNTRTNSHTQSCTALQARTRGGKRNTDTYIHTNVHAVSVMLFGPAAIRSSLSPSTH